MYLYINTSSSDKIILALSDKKGNVLKLKKNSAPYQQSEKLLTEIEKLLTDRKVIRLLNYQIIKLSGIIIVSGPGGFTSLRIGIATANAMAWALQIPIVGVEWNSNQIDKDLILEGIKKLAKIKKFKQILPKYGSEPNINITKK
jgi:tRNA A37 threonylcarbamoyladenosine modification protein TsaB